jgi:acetyltransferase-like isoleucine patch superfamily enzyme
MSAASLVHQDWFSRAIPANVEIGAGGYLDSAYTFLHCESELPVAVRIGQNSGIYVETFFDLGPKGYVEIGKHCTLAGPVISTNGQVVIGDYVLISWEAVIADHFWAVPARSRGRARALADAPVPVPIYIGNNAWIGTRAVLLPGARLGEGAIVGAGTVVDFPVPDYAVVAGNPARIVAWAKPRDAAHGAADATEARQ